MLFIMMQLCIQQKEMNFTAYFKTIEADLN
jgi:hypothetical protein